MAVVLIALNEAHNMESVLDNLAGWAQEVFLVDSYSQDSTVEIALRRGVHVVQRRFRGFGDQWNFALRELPISAAWTMKLDPDERLSERLKASIDAALRKKEMTGFTMDRRLWFMGRPLPVRHRLVRLWQTGKCRFTDVEVNEHPVVRGSVGHVAGELEHYDSPDLEHWLNKQNKYTTSEAIAALSRTKLADEPRLWGTVLQRRMWMKHHYQHVPFRYAATFVYHYLIKGAWRAGKAGWMWSHLRTEVYRLRSYKLYEMRKRGVAIGPQSRDTGATDGRVRQYE